MQKLIFVLGGVVSSLGKGIITSSISGLLINSGYKVLTKKADPYLNIDPGTLSPYEHGEVFVTKDGGETDLDLGHYERFTGKELSRISSITAGAIYKNVLENERNGKYGGKTTQLVPHVTDAIKNKFKETDDEYDFIVVEVGGTVGDLESQIFLESIRQMKQLGRDVHCMVIHTALLPRIEVSNETKTKPVQHSIKQLHATGIHPDSIILRYDRWIKRDEKEIEKISNLTGVKKEDIFVSYDVDSIYSVPLVLEKQGILSSIENFFKLSESSSNVNVYKEFQTRLSKREKTKNVGIVGKYSNLKDSYLSIAESLIVASTYVGVKLNIIWVSSEDINDDNAKKCLSKLNAIVVAPGFGERGTHGKMLTLKFARENKIPVLGICFGMQMAVVEFLNNVCKQQVTSLEFSETAKIKNYAISVLEGKEENNGIGGTLRLGNFKCHLKEGSKARQLYKSAVVDERHRHRYEVNNDYVELMEKNGMKVVGCFKEKNLVEVIELENHPFFIGCQFHPEYKTNIWNPHPLFVGLLEATK